MTRCPTCGGLGEVKHPSPQEAGKVRGPTCGGTGQIPEAPPTPAPAPSAAEETSEVADTLSPPPDLPGTGDG